LAVGVYELGDAIVKDCYNKDVKATLTLKTLSQEIGAFAGAGGGAHLLGTLGFLAGGPLGLAIGEIAGGVIGGYIGGRAGDVNNLADFLYSKNYKGTGGPGELAAWAQAQYTQNPLDKSAASFNQLLTTSNGSGSWSNYLFGGQL
jgi:hypothetical protein